MLSTSIKSLSRPNFGASESCSRPATPLESSRRELMKMLPAIARRPERRQILPQARLKHYELAHTGKRQVDVNTACQIDGCRASAMMRGLPWLLQRGQCTSRSATRTEASGSRGFTRKSKSTTVPQLSQLITNSDVL